jgi:hypothetical protein
MKGYRPVQCWARRREGRKLGRRGGEEETGQRGERHREEEDLLFSFKNVFLLAFQNYFAN